MKRLKSNFHRLHNFKDAQPKLRKAIIANCDKELVNSFSECALNLLHGLYEEEVTKLQTSAQNGS